MTTMITLMIKRVVTFSYLLVMVAHPPISIGWSSADQVGVLQVVDAAPYCSRTRRLMAKPDGGIVQFSDGRIRIRRQIQRQQQNVYGTMSTIIQELRGGDSSSSSSSSSSSPSWEGDDDTEDRHYDGHSFGYDQNEDEEADDDDTDAMLVSVIPDAILPQALSGGGATTTTTTDLAMRSVQWAAFWNRTITASLVAALLTIIAYYFHEDGLVALCVTLQCLMYQETTKVIGGDLKDWFRKWWWFGTALLLLDGSKAIPWRKDVIEAISFTMASIGVVSDVIRLQTMNGTPADFREFLRQAAVSLLGIVLVVWPSSFWVATLQEYGMSWMFVPALFVVLNDTFAYLGGVLFGKHSLLPAISPKKTWEGFLFASFVTMGVAWAVGTAIETGSVVKPSWYPLDKMDGLVVAAFASFVAPFGGFLASVIKRAYGQKDFGTALPGHGGVVDRLDCQLFLAPFVFFYLTLYKFAAGGGGGSGA